MAGTLMVVAWFMAAKEALDLEWVETVVAVLLGGLALAAIMVVAGVVLGLLGLGAAAAGNAALFLPFDRMPFEQLDKKLRFMIPLSYLPKV